MSGCADKQSSRRYFFTGVLRHTAAAILAATGGAAVVKRRRLLREGRCLNHGICSSCKIFDDCGLPQALSAKSFLGRNGNG